MVYWHQNKSTGKYDNQDFSAPPDNLPLDTAPPTGKEMSDDSQGGGTLECRNAVVVQIIWEIPVPGMYSLKNFVSDAF